MEIGWTQDEPIKELMRSMTSFEFEVEHITCSNDDAGAKTTIRTPIRT
jgi:hypothetical protein